MTLSATGFRAAGRVRMPGSRASGPAAAPEPRQRASRGGCEDDRYHFFHAQRRGAVSHAVRSLAVGPSGSPRARPAVPCRVGPAGRAVPGEPDQDDPHLQRGGPGHRVGCGIVVNDRLVDGMHGGSGQVGHIPISDWGPLCERGHRGCARAFLAAPSIVNQSTAALGRPVDYATVLDLAATGEPMTRRIVTEACQALGTLIGTVAAVTAPAKVIVSGEGVMLAAADLALVKQRAQTVKHWTVPEVPIEIAPFTFTEWARGAAVIALRHQLDAAVRVEG